MSLHRFEQTVRAVHDHLYANANIRTPEELQNEVAKVLITLAWGGQNGSLGPLDVRLSRAVQRGDLAECKELADVVRTTFESYKQVHTQYETNDALLLDERSIAYVTASLATYAYSGNERDWLGDALEVFRSTAAKRLGGQFFTDQRVTDLAMTLLEYEPDRHDMLDVSAGTGGFLLSAHKQARKAGQLDARIYGIEVDAKLAHLGNSTLKHFGVTRRSVVFQSDSLRPPSDWPVDLRRAVIDGTHQRLAGNPPFGAKITVKDPAVLQRFQLGRAWSKDSGGVWTASRRVVPRPPDILFLERNLQLAEPGVGRVALVTPYQTLSGPKLGFVREWLMREARLVAVVDLPADTFQPWTGTKTALVVYERRQRPLDVWCGDEEHAVFMGIARHIGHDRRGNPVEDANGQVKTDLPAIAEAFRAWRAGQNPSKLHDGCFEIPASRINRQVDLRINASFHRPEASEARSHLATASSDHYDVVKLGSLVQRVFCPGRFKRRYVDDASDGVLFLGGSNISQAVTTNRKYLSKEDPHLPELQVEEGWVLLTRSGSTGIVSSVPSAWAHLAISEHVIRIVPKDNFPAGYIEAYLRSELGQRLLAAGVFGSVIDEITPEFVANLPVPVPCDENFMHRVASLQDAARHARDAAVVHTRAASVALDAFTRDSGVFWESAVTAMPVDDLR